MIQEENLKDLLFRFNEFIREKNITPECLIEEFSKLFNTLEKDWEKDYNRLEETLSLFLVKTKCSKEEMQFVCQTVLDWRERIEGINAQIEPVRDLKRFLDDLKREAVWE